MISRFGRGVLAVAILIVWIARAHAQDVSTTKLQIRDASDPQKRQVLIQSRDSGVQYLDAVAPEAGGAVVHLYSSTDDDCILLDAGSNWSTNGKAWKYKDRATKNRAQMGDGKLKIKIKSGIAYTLADNAGQGSVNAIVQFGSGSRYCLRCDGNSRDDDAKFQAKNCPATPCDPEPTVCEIVVTTTTTTTTTTLPGSDALSNIPTSACSVSQAQLEAATQPHQYVESDNGVTRSITANGIPDHAVGPFPNAGNPNTISAQNYNYTVSVTPAGPGASVTKVFAIAESGVVFDPYTAEFWNDNPAWRYEALRYATAPDYFASNGGGDGTFHPSELGADCNYAHVQPNGAYHYHGIPEQMLPATPGQIFLGWAADGYPVFGRWGYVDANDAGSGVAVMRSSYRLKTGARGAGAPSGDYDGTFVADWEYQAGLGDLDDCNGRTGVVTIGASQYTSYHYYVTDTYPYIPRCFEATPDSSFNPGPPPGP